MAQAIKKRHHHVPQLYLKRWATDGKLWCLRGDTIFSTKPLNLANRHFFYQTEDVSVEDLAPYWELAKHMTDADDREAMKDWIRDYWDLAQMVRGIIGREDELPALADQIHRLQKNSVEDEYSIFEPILELFLGFVDLDTTHFYHDDIWETLVQVLADQYFRTVGQRAKGDAFGRLVQDKTFNRGWQVRNKLFAKILASSFLRRRDDHALVLLRNQTSVPFLTGDQPVINIHAHQHFERKAKAFEIYYPVSPSRAVMLVQKYDETTDTLDISLTAHVHGFNQLMRNNAHSELYASTPCVLRPYIPLLTENKLADT